jgi:FMN reductase
MSKLNIVGISGSLSRPSRTSTLVSAVLDAIREREVVGAQLIDLADAASGLFAASSFDRLSRESRQIIDDVENADLLVTGTPVYRGSYTGAFKHLFDLVRHDRLRGTPVVLTATGGSQMHGLVTEHQLRPLFGFFSALSLPTTIYATEADFQNYVLVGSAVRQRVAAAATEAVRALSLGARAPRPEAAPAALAATA